MTDQNRVILTRGLQGSGKTTWAKEFVRQQNSRGWRFVNINRDDIRETLFGAYWAPDYGFHPKTEGIVTKAQDQMAEAAAASKMGIVVSDTNLNQDTVNKWKQFAIRNGMSFETNDTFMHVPVETCIERDSMRIHPCGRDIIEKTYKRYKTLFDSYGVGYDWNPSNKKVNIMTYDFEYVPNKDLPKAFIFDVDGTLTEMSSLRGPFEYHKVDLDLPHYHVIEIAQTLYSAGYAIIIVTGREGTDVCQEKTKLWLEMFSVPYTEIHFRGEKDFRKDSVVKHEIFFNNIAEKYNVLGVFDDRTQVVRTWRSMGLSCFQVAQHDF